MPGRRRIVCCNIIITPRAPALKPRVPALRALRGPPMDRPSGPPWEYSAAAACPACPWTAEALWVACCGPEGKGPFGEPIFGPGCYSRAAVRMPALLGLDLLDRGERPLGPDPPELPLPSQPPGPWPWWAPAWVELPMPFAVPERWYWHASSKFEIPAVWIVPHGCDSRGARDPEAVVMLWIDADTAETRCSPGVANARLPQLRSLSPLGLLVATQLRRPPLRYIWYREMVREGVLAPAILAPQIQ